MVDDVLICRAALSERVQLVHVVHVAPQCRQLLRNIKVDEILRRYPYVLQTWHQLTVETAHRVTSQKSGAPSPQMLINPPQMCQELCTFVLVLFD